MMITGVTVVDEIGWCESVICEKPSREEYELVWLVESAMLKIIMVKAF
jgi:hypothetical protein